MNNFKVKQLVHNNQFILENNKKVVFQSYNSIIAIFDKEKQTLTFGKDWDYSNTTLKHLYLFIGDYIWYYLDLGYDLRESLLDVMNSNNKKRGFQKLIDKKIIKYNKDLV